MRGDEQAPDRGYGPLVTCLRANAQAGELTRRRIGAFLDSSLLLVREAASVDGLKGEGWNCEAEIIS